MPDGKYLSCLEVKTDEIVYLFRMDDGMIQMLEEETGTTSASMGTTSIWKVATTTAEATTLTTGTTEL